MNGGSRMSRDVAAAAILETYFRHDPARGSFKTLPALVTASRARDYARRRRDGFLDATRLLDPRGEWAIRILEAPFQRASTGDHAAFVAAKVDFERCLSRLAEIDPDSAVYLFSVRDWTLRRIACFLNIPRSTVLRKLRNGVVVSSKAQ
jgi:DNA-directed RNA polymerase specialized sigma24 family protein